jgi:hypothetical protein
MVECARTVAERPGAWPLERANGNEGRAWERGRATMVNEWTLFQLSIVSFTMVDGLSLVDL